MSAIRLETRNGKDVERSMAEINATNAVLVSRDRRWTAIISIASIAVLSPGVFWGLPGGVNIVGADRVLDGDIPYRDFWTMYAPGQFYLTAGLFWLFGRHLLVQGIAAVVLRGLAAGMLFRLVRRLEVSRPAAAVVSTVFVSSLWSTAPQIDSYVPILPLLLIAIERVVAFLRQRDGRSLMIAGALLGVAAWFKHDVAAYVAIAVVASLLVMHLTTRGTDSRSGFSGSLAIPCVIGAAIAVALPVVGLIAWYAGADVWQNLFVFPAGDFRGVRAEAYPSLVPNLTPLTSWLQNVRNVYKLRDALEYLSGWILCSAPQLVFLISMAVVFVRRRSLKRDTFATVVLFLAMLVLFWSAAHVQRNTHLYSMALVSLCLGAMAWQASSDLLARRRVVRIGLMAGLGVYAIGLLIPPAMQLSLAMRDASGSRSLEFPGVSGIRVSREEYEAYHPIVSFIRRNVAEDERIYVGLERHDATVIGNMRFYYLSQRRNCCRHDELHPGITDRIDVQRDIIDAIQEHRVRCIVLWKFGWEESVLDAIKARNAAAVEGAGSDLLDRFIDANFEPVAQYGEYKILWRKGMPYRAGES